MSITLKQLLFSIHNYERVHLCSRLPMNSGIGNDTWFKERCKYQRKLSLPIELAFFLNIKV